MEPDLKQHAALPMFDAFVEAALVGGPPETMSSLISYLRPHGTARRGAERTLTSSTLGMRLIGLAFLLTDLGYGANPQFASGLGNALLRVWFERIDGAAFGSRLEEHSTLLTVVRTTAQSYMWLGEFDQCIQIIDEFLTPEKFGRFGEQYVSAYLRKVEALAHQLKIAEAVEALRKLTPEQIALTDDVEVVWRYIAPYIVDTLAPDGVFDFDTRVRELVNGPLAQNKRTVALWAHSLNEGKEPEESFDWAMLRVGVLADDLEHLTAVSRDPALTGVDRVDQLMRGLNAFSLKARELVLGGGPVSQFDLHSADERIDYAAMVVGLVNPAGDEIDRALDAAREATAWCRGKGCRRGLLSALQAERTLYVRANQWPEAKEANLRLHDELRSLREQSPMPETRAAISRVYRRLSYGICLTAGEFADPNEAFSATEFRRGLSIAEPRRPAGWKDPDPLIAPLNAELLGPNTHYLGLTAFDEDDRIAASLYCADGTIAFQWIPLTPSQFRRVAERINPREWDGRPPILGKATPDLRSHFACLLEPLREAFISGRMMEGDHVCVAVDDPMHAVPLHYLPLEGRPAVQLLSFSRVASLADARLIFESVIARPHNALAAFIPAMPERNLDLKAQAFYTVCDTLKRAGVEVTRIEGPMVDQAALVAALAAYSLVYIHSHGSFREDVDAIDFSGILVAKDGRLPLRGSSNHWLLTPRHVLESCVSLPQSVIALSACVSGLGRRGLGGDTIGLEFALRARGASTVIASHWDITWQSAAGFFESFIRRWLVLGESRAHAWRQSILDRAHINDIGYEEPFLLEACAFSLFGDWR